MRIELKKNIEVKSIEVIAEVDFFKESPYIKLLEGFSHQTELENKLKADNFIAPEINNIIKNLESLGVIKNGTISNLENGFPERELGKYKISYYENDTSRPFKFHIRSIERIEAVSKNIADNIMPLDKQFLSQLENETCNDFSTKEKFRVLEIIDGKGHSVEKTRQEEVTIILANENWSYILDNIEFSFELGIDKNILFNGKWIDKDNLCEENFEEISSDETVIQQFKRDYLNKQSIPGWGEFNITYKNIPVVPNKESQEKWFLHILKIKIVSENKYYTPDELEQKWDNLFYTTPQISRLGEVPFNYEQILRHFDKKTEVYWLLQTGVDLNPFKTTSDRVFKKNMSTIIIQEEDEVHISAALEDLNLESASHLTILDRYINTTRHFEVLFDMKNAFNNLDISITSMAEHKPTSNDSLFISNGCKEHNIDRNISSRHDVPHDRHWKIDNKIYIVSKSLDFMTKISNGHYKVKQTIFTPLDISEIEPLAKRLLGGQNE